MVTIYAKTADGQNEIDTRARRVSPRARSALILVDGKRTDKELGELIQQADDTLRTLLDAGLIAVVSHGPGKSASAREPEPAAPAAPALAPADFEALRRDAVRAVNELLGPQAESLAIKLERAANIDDLRASLERAVAYIANAHGGGAAAQFASRFLPGPPDA